MSTTSLRESPVSAVLSGLIIGFMQIIFATSLASLIFTGGLGSFLPRAIGIAIVATAVASGTVALLSARGVQGRIQSAPNALFVAVAGGVLAAGGNPETVLVSIVVTTLLTSAVILIMTALNLGALVRFLPYPVVAGFLAGTGWLLITGAISTMLDAPSDANILMLLASPDQFILWIPGVLVAVALLIVPRFINHPLSLPITLGLIIAIFFIGLRVAGITLDEAAGIGLLLGDLGEIRWRLLSTDLLAQTNWQAILAQSGTIATVIAISVVHLLLNASGLESVLEEDVDLNKELRVSGLLNFIATLTGGFIGYQSLSLSALSTKLAGRTRLIGIIAAVVSIIALLIGGELLFFFPRPLLGGLLLFLGLELIEDWVISAWKRFALPEYAVILIILVTIATTDFLTGVGVGLVLMVIIFVVSYSQLSPVRSQLDATMIRSSVERPRRFRDTLDKLGKRVLIMEMQGFLFFGTAHSLYERIRGAYDDEPPRYLILDFSRVNGLDSSAAFSFSKVKRLADQFKTEVVFTAANENHLAFLQYSGFDPEKAHRFPDLDHG
ncbi:MAG: SulP family inorganic anion transporter, partial [Chloroflexi bacterium]|nr:SulP family inorganic anion transporter [Chloroflexota bacterium]